MNKWIGIKKEVINLRSLLINYKKIIPKQQLPRFEKDLNILFEKYEVLENDIELEKMKKLAKTKLNSMIRVYGELKEEETTVDKDFLDQNSNDFAEKIINDTKQGEYENSDYKEDYMKRLNQLKNSQFFKKEYVNQVHNEINDFHNMILQAQKQAEKKNLENQKKDIEQNRSVWMEKYKKRLKDIVVELCKKKDVSDINESLKSIDFDKMADYLIQMDLNPKEDKEEKMEEILASFENILSGSRKTEDLFINFRKNTVNERIDELSKNEDLKTFLNQKLENIKNDEKMTIEEKARSFIKEQWKAENDIIKDKLDGEIRINPYGNLEFDFFKESYDSINNSSEETKEKDENTGVKTYHWKDGKLVEGKAKQRHTTTYSNWHSGNINPDDLKRHRSLLDRQHYSGPLWDGIKPKSIMNDPSVFMDIDNYKTDKSTEQVLKIDKEGKQEWEEIVR